MADFDKLVKNLEADGYTVSVFDTKQSATDYICANTSGKTVGFGGSVTIKEMGLYEALSKNNTTYWHWASDGKISGYEMLKAEQSSEIFISSVNGISENGEIVNIDGNCNRVSSISFGHEKVYLVVGQNKIAENLDAAIYRARNIAAVKNAIRLKRNTPCAVKGDRCYDCSSPDRICRELSVLMKKPSLQDMEVIIIKEDLGY